MMGTSNQNQSSVRGVVDEAKLSIIFDSYASLDDPNADSFGLSLECAAGPMVKDAPTNKPQINDSTFAWENQSRSFSSASEHKEPTIKNSSSSEESDKPKRPLSAYNLFFQLERERLIAGTTDTPFTAEDVGRIVDARRIQMNESQHKRKHRKTHGSKSFLWKWFFSVLICFVEMIISQHRTIPFFFFYHSTEISFAELARVIAANWKTLKHSEKELLRECAAIEKTQYLKELEEWTKSNNETQRRESLGKQEWTKSNNETQRRESLGKQERPLRPSHDHMPPSPRRNCSTPWQHEESIAHLDAFDEPPSPVVMPPPPPPLCSPSTPWQHENSIANFPEAPVQPLWSSPTSTVEKSSFSGMPSGAVPAFQRHDDFTTMRGENTYFADHDRRVPFSSMAPVQRMQEQQQQQQHHHQPQHHRDYVGMFQKIDVHDSRMRFYMMPPHAQHQISQREHLQYGAAYHQQQQMEHHHHHHHQPVIDTQRRVRRPRR